MKEKTAYCLNCDNDQKYIVKKEKRKVTVRDLTFNVFVKVAFCQECGEEVFPVEVSKENDLIIFDEYRRRKGLLTSEEIKSIRKKRNMSQVELARFIKCGDKNIARYERGTIQDNVFDFLIRLVKDDEVFAIMQKMNDSHSDVNEWPSVSIHFQINQHYDYQYQNTVQKGMKKTYGKNAINYA